MPCHLDSSKFFYRVFCLMRRYYKSGGKICPSGKAWAKRTFDTYPSAYANMAASKYCKDPSYAKGSKKKKKKKA